MSLNGFDGNDVMVVQENNMETKIGREMRNKIPSIMYKDYVTHVIRKVKSLKQQNFVATLILC